MKRSPILGLIFVAAVWLFAGQAQAQYSQPFSGGNYGSGAYGGGNRFSPALQLLGNRGGFGRGNAGNFTSNYLLNYRPQVSLNQVRARVDVQATAIERLRREQRALAEVDQSREVLDAQRPSSGATTGHSAAFLNYRGYFPVGPVGGSSSR